MSSRDRLEAKRLERRVMIGVAFLVAFVIGTVVAANLSGRHEAAADDRAVASAVTAADPGDSASPLPGILPAGSPDNPAARATRPALIDQASGDPVLARGFGGLRLGKAATWANLTIYPVSRPDSAETAPAEARIGTLNEGMSNNMVTVVEPALTVTNNGSQPTFVPGGQVMPGGGQDQGVAGDALISPHSRNIGLESFCVEPRRSFGPSSDYAAGGAIAIPAVRYPMQVLGDQEAVWSAVADATSHFGAQSPTGAYEALVTNQSALAAVQPYADSLEPRIADDNWGRSVGAVVVLNGHVLCADIFASPTLFARLWPSLVRSYALQAALCPQKAGTAPQSFDQSAAAAWLASLDTAPGLQKDGAPGTESAQVSVSQGAGVRTAITAAGRATLVHEAFWSPEALQDLGS